MKTISKKSITFSIILLFIGVSISSGISVDTETTDVEDCKECNEIDDTHLLILDRQLNRLEIYSKLLLVLSRYYPELEEISEELSNEISILNKLDLKEAICNFLDETERKLIDTSNYLRDVLYHQLYDNPFLATAVLMISGIYLILGLMLRNIYRTLDC
jgi:hypothetical protein